MAVDLLSPYYPYVKAQESYYDLSETVTLPRKIADYLIDAPTGAYIPPDDNKYPRCRLWKYLYYDGAKPLGEPLPTIQQKMSVVFNPNNPQAIQVDAMADGGYMFNGNGRHRIIEAREYDYDIPVRVTGRFD